MRRLFPALAGLTAVAPIVLVWAMVAQVPPSALTVPKVRVAAASGGEPIRLSPAALGASRTADGLRVRHDRLDHALEELSRRMARAAVPARYEKTEDGIFLNRGIPGLELDVERARAMLVEALRSGSPSLTLPIVEVPPPQPERYALVVRVADYRLDLYEATVLKKRYLVGVGALRFPTPPGEYHIKSKAKNPTWNNPGSSWARAMPASVPPGPRNPLGSRALRLDRESLVIHGTPQPGSVGHRSSHGCMRMYKADVEELFDLLPVGTPVFIIP